MLPFGKQQGTLRLRAQRASVRVAGHSPILLGDVTIRLQNPPLVSHPDLDRQRTDMSAPDEHGGDFRNQLLRVT